MNQKRELVPTYLMIGCTLRGVSDLISLRALVNDRRAIAEECVVLSGFYGHSKNREIGKELLIKSMMFLQTENFISGRPHYMGLEEHPFLVTLRNAVFTDEVATIPPLPQELLEFLS